MPLVPAGSAPGVVGPAQAAAVPGGDELAMSEQPMLTEDSPMLCKLRSKIGEAKVRQSHLAPPETH
jgi:hypothetical protein